MLDQIILLGYVIFITLFSQYPVSLSVITLRFKFITYSSITIIDDAIDVLLERKRGFILVTIRNELT